MSAIQDDNLEEVLADRAFRGQRLSKMPLIIGGVVVVVFVVVFVQALIAATDRNNRVAKPEKKTAAQTSNFADTITAKHTGIVQPPAAPASPQSAKADGHEPPTVPAQAHPAPVVPAQYYQYQPPPQAPRQPRQAGGTGSDKTESEAARKRREERLAALKASSRVDLKSDEAGGAIDKEAPYGKFAGAGDRWTLGNKVDVPQNPNMLRTGAVIPATMISGINSDLPGQITAQVSQNVYDTKTHTLRLIPQGATLVGTYDHQVVYGQERVLVAWQRIVFPGADALDIGAMPGADQAGYSGFHDRADHHYGRIFGSAVLMSLITAGATYSQNLGTGGQVGFGNQQSAQGALSQALGQQLGQASSQLLMKNLNVAPTLEIEPGFRFVVAVTKDLVLDHPY